jgi:hypothetical protein
LPGSRKRWSTHPLPRTSSSRSFCSVKHMKSFTFPRIVWALRYLSSLKHYAASRNGIGSTHDEVNGFFNLSNPSSRNMTLGSTQALTELGCRLVRVSQVHMTAMLVL